MAKAKTVFLNQQEMDLIHAQSIKSLQEIGIKVHSKPVLEILEKNGASVDYKAMVAKIPEKMVNQALESVQKEFTLCARDPKPKGLRASPGLVFTTSYSLESKSQMALSSSTDIPSSVNPQSSRSLLSKNLSLKIMLSKNNFLSQ